EIYSFYPLETAQAKPPTEEPHRGSSRRSSEGSNPSTSKPNSDHKGSAGHRRRQWGSHSGERVGSALPAVSSDTLEKLVPTLNTDGGQKSRNRGSSSISRTVQSNTPSTLSSICEDFSSSRKPTDSSQIKNEDTVVESTISTAKPCPINGNGSSVSSNIPADSSSAQKDIENKTHNANGALQNKPLGKRKGPKETKAVGYLIEAPERIEPVAPAKHRPTNIIYIRSLVRPFTADQLRQMISERFGPVSDLWLDRIKSSSLVRLESVEVATRCREGLDGCRWPSMNPHCLHCDFGNDALLAWMQEHGNSGENVPPKYLVLGESPPEVTESEGATTRVSGSRKKSEADPKSHSTAKSTDRRQTKSERTDEGSQPIPKEIDAADSADGKRKYEEPAKLLDDLFRKTSSTPCIYWLPLPEEQARKQAAERVKLLRTNPPTTARPLSRPFPHGPSGPKQRATRSPFTSPVEQEKIAAVRGRSSGHRSDEPKPRPVPEPDPKDKSSTVSRKETPATISHARPRSRSTDLRRRRERVSISPPRVAPSSRSEPRSRDHRPTSPSGRVTKQPVTRKRDQASPSPPRPRVVRRSTSSRSRSRLSSSSASSRSSSRHSRSRRLENTRHGKASFRGSGRPHSRSVGRKRSSARGRR
ncbi:Apoptotic chromatin condensation inducer in the nucleus, partial [Fasciolopsis buskii]